MASIAIHTCVRHLTSLVSNLATTSLHKTFTVFWVNGVAAEMEAQRFKFLREDVMSEKREVKMTQLSVTSRPRRRKAGE